MKTDFASRGTGGCDLPSICEWSIHTTEDQGWLFLV